MRPRSANQTAVRNSLSSLRSMMGCDQSVATTYQALPESERSDNARCPRLGSARAHMFDLRRSVFAITG